MMGYKGDCYMDASEFAGISLGKTSAGPGEGTGYGSGIGTGWGDGCGTVWGEDCGDGLGSGSGYSDCSGDGMGWDEDSWVYRS